MSAAGITAFISTIIYAGLTIAFTVLASKSKSKGAIANDPGLYYGLGAVFLAAAVILDFIIIFTPNDPTLQVRLSAMDIVALVALLLLMITVVRLDKRLGKWKELPQILLFISWVFMLLSLIFNLWVFFGVHCKECVCEQPSNRK
jgi:hypothetical protein